MKEGELKGKNRWSFSKQQVADTEVKARVILNEQRQAFIEHANYNLKSELRQQDVEFYSKSHDCEKSRQAVLA